jgi:hypothetical protein
MTAPAISRLDPPSTVPAAEPVRKRFVVLERPA